MEAFRDSCKGTSIQYIYNALNAWQNHADLSKLKTAIAYKDTLSIIVPTYVSESNLQEGLIKLFDWYATETLADADEQWLRDMAEECPYDEGSMVYVARSVLMQLDTFPSWTVNDCELSEEPPSSKYAEEETESANPENDEYRLSVYPNPNNGEFTVAFNNCDDSEKRYKMTIMDVTGKTVYSRSILCSSQSLNLRNLCSGTYLMQVVTEDYSERWNYKLVLLE